MKILSRKHQEAVAVGDPAGCGPRHIADEILQAWKNDNIMQPIFAGRRALRVLVADDNRDAADSLSMLVRMWGHDVQTAYDGVVALTIATAFQPNVLLLDLTMPKRNGYQLVQELRSQTCFKTAFFVAVTGWADKAHRLLCAEAGFDHYLIKPIELSFVEELLLLQKQRLVKARETTS